MNAHEILWFAQHGRRYFGPVRDPHLRPDPFLRHDAHLFLPPQLQMAMKAAEHSLTQTESAIDSEQQRREAASQLRALLDLKTDIVKLRSDLAFERFKRTYYRWLEAERLRRKAGFRPEQPRVPAGNPDGGKWTAGGGQGISGGSRREPASSGNTDQPLAHLAQYMPPVVRPLPPLLLQKPPVVARPFKDWPADPTKSPAPGFQWRGQPGSSPGDGRGNYFNEQTRESLRPDFSGKEHAPHWDWMRPRLPGIRLYPDGRMEIKPSILFDLRT